MGAGKAVAIGAVCAAAEPSDDETIVVSTSSQYLVRQLHRTLVSVLAEHGRGCGRFYARDKSWNCPVVVACMPSLGLLAETLRAHNRRVALWMPDEVHRTEAATVLDAHQILKPERALGWTATPFRASRTERLSLWNTLLYNYSPADAMRDHIVVPWRIVHYEGREAGLRDDVCTAMIASAKGPGMVNADGIADAKAFSDRLNTHPPVRADCIHSEMGLRDQGTRILKLRDGELSALVHVAMLQEGVDWPWLRWLCLRRCVESRVRFIQEVGRVLRAHPGKEEAVVYDPHDLFGVFKLDYKAVLGGESELPDAALAAPKPEFV